MAILPTSLWPLLAAACKGVTPLLSLTLPMVPQELAIRARILIASARGDGVRPLARRLEILPNTVSVGGRRYQTEGLAGVRTRPRTGRRKQITAAKERAIVAAPMPAPTASTHWSSRRLAKGGRG